MMAQKVPTVLQRMTSHQWRNVSFTPSMTPPSFFTCSVAMLERWTPRSMISGMAKNPMVMGISPSPSQRKTWPKVNRWTPVCGSSPTVERKRPIPAASRAFSKAPPLSEAIKVRPRIASMKSSGEPKVRTSGRTTGMVRARMKAPKMAPTSELMSTAPRARPASPFFAMAWPSMMVAAAVASPGTPKRTDVMSPVVPRTEAIPRRMAKASTGFILMTKGSMRAMVAEPPNPGRIPTMKPIPMPMSIRENVPQVKICDRPDRNALSRSIMNRS